MKDRIAHIMRAKNLKASDFAEMLGIQPSGISHILSGRNQPSLDFVKKIKETFPEYNLDWIIFGSGPMTTSEPFKEKTVSNDGSSLPSMEATLNFDPSIPLADSNSFDSSDSLVASPTTLRAIIFFYEDGTFERFSPK